MIIKSVLKRKSFYGFVLLMVMNLFLISLPLTNSLGFEFAFVNAIILFLVGGFVSITYLKNNDAGLLCFYRDNWQFLLLIILIPFIIGFLSSLFASRCPIKDGLGFYLTITIPSLIFGNITGAISVILSRRFSSFIFIIIFILLALLVLVEFYFNPQVYFYNLIFGFFPGTIYDEDVAVNLKLILSQLYNFLFLVSLYFSLKFANKKYKSGTLLYLILFISLAVFFLLKPFLGFSTDSWKMNKELDRKVITQHFVIHFSANIKRSEQNYISLLHEYYYEQVTSKLEVRLDERITSYIYKSQEQKRELFGAGNANVAKPWLNQIYLNHENYQLALKHEIAHIAAAKFGATILKVADRFNPAMIEGLAMFVEDDFNGYRLSYSANLAYATGYRIDLKNLFVGMNFFTSYSSMAYLYSGAFITYLYDEYGIGKIKDIYSDTDWMKVFGVNLNTLITRFENKLSKERGDFNPYKAKLYFGGQTIFKKYCPRMASNDLKEANNYFNEKKYDKAGQLYNKIYVYSNSYPAISGNIASLNKLGKYSASLNIIQNEMQKFSNNQAVYNLQIQSADTYALMGDTSNAMKSYDSLLVNSPHINYDNEVKIRKLVLRKYGPDSLKSYFDLKREKRIELLLRLNENYLLYFTLPALFRRATAIEYDLTNWLENKRDIFIVSNYESFFASISVSKYYLQRNDLNKAKLYAIKAVNFKADSAESYRAIEILRMANWFYSFAEDTRKAFQYSK